MNDTPEPRIESPSEAGVVPLAPPGLDAKSDRAPLDPEKARSFRSFVATQFLGAFNDNAFKQLILLLAVGITGDAEAGIYQPLATAVFSLPFVLFSGFAGSVADRFSKTTVIVWAKVAEIAIMLSAVISFVADSMTALLITLFFMGTQSAFFGPAKYGYMPESLPDRRLPRANGTILMTTFLAIILGQGAAGILKSQSGSELWKPACVFVVLAVVGTLTALRIRPIPPAQPNVSLRRPWGDLGPSLATVARDSDFLWVVAANSYFWFLGGSMQQIVNAYGKRLMALDDARTSFLLVSLSAGLAAGAVLGGWLARGRIDFRHTLWGSFGAAAALFALVVAHSSYPLALIVFFTLGVSGSLFGLPLQTFIQKRAESDQKGRILAATGFINWIFIFMSAAYFAIATALLPTPWLAVPLAPMTVLIALAIQRRG